MLTENALPLRGCKQTRLASYGKMLTSRFLNLLHGRLALANLWRQIKSNYIPLQESLNV